MAAGLLWRMEKEEEEEGEGGSARRSGLGDAARAKGGKQCGTESLCVHTRAHTPTQTIVLVCGITRSRYLRGWWP